MKFTTKKIKDLRATERHHLKVVRQALTEGDYAEAAMHLADAAAAQGAVVAYSRGVQDGDAEAKR